MNAVSYNLLTPAVLLRDNDLAKRAWRIAASFLRAQRFAQGGTHLFGARTARGDGAAKVRRGVRASKLALLTKNL